MTRSDESWLHADSESFEDQQAMQGREDETTASGVAFTGIFKANKQHQEVTKTMTKRPANKIGWRKMLQMKKRNRDAAQLIDCIKKRINPPPVEEGQDFWMQALRVPPPSNVTVNCQNLQTTVSWDYSEHQPHTIFQVKICGTNTVRSFEANTTDHQYDFSDFVWESQEHYMAFLCVNVTAIQGGKQSEVVRSKSFSFNMLRSVDIKCMLDFPPVDVLRTEKRSSVGFQNPVKFYNELKRTIKQDGVLEYTVSSATE
ncbi:hypothetical protein AMECASPLE_034020, partial [Ameca splendens]